MSDTADIYREFDERQKIKRQKNLKWNTDVLLWAEVEYGFKLEKRSDYHYSLYHPKRGRMDYWPSTNRIGWFHNNKQYGKTVLVADIEAYLMQNFKP